LSDALRENLRKRKAQARARAAGEAADRDGEARSAPSEQSGNDTQA
jgi:hypothetical protein